MLEMLICTKLSKLYRIILLNKEKSISKFIRSCESGRMWMDQEGPRSKYGQGEAGMRNVITLIRLDRFQRDVGDMAKISPKIRSNKIIP